MNKDGSINWPWYWNNLFGAHYDAGLLAWLSLLEDRARIDRERLGGLAVSHAETAQTVRIHHQRY